MKTITTASILTIMSVVILLALPAMAAARNYDDSFVNKKSTSPTTLSGKMSSLTYTRTIRDDGVSRYYLTPGPSLPPFSASHFGTKTQYRAGTYLGRAVPQQQAKANQAPEKEKISAVRTFAGFQGKLNPSAGFSSRRYVK